MPTVTIALEGDGDRAGTGADTLEPWNSVSVGDSLIIEHRNQDVQVRQQVAQPARRGERNGEQPARTERRHALVEFVARRFDRITERLEQSAEKCDLRTGLHAEGQPYEWKLKQTSMPTKSRWGIEPVLGLPTVGLLTGMAIPAGHSAGRSARGYQAIRAIVN